MRCFWRESNYTAASSPSPAVLPSPRLRLTTTDERPPAVDPVPVDPKPRYLIRLAASPGSIHSSLHRPSNTALAWPCRSSDLHHVRPTLVSRCRSTRSPGTGSGPRSPTPGDPRTVLGHYQRFHRTSLRSVVGSILELLRLHFTPLLKVRAHHLVRGG